MSIQYRQVFFLRTIFQGHQMNSKYTREHELILKTGFSPVTPVDITAALEQLELRTDLPVMLHSSLSSMGWIVGGAQTVIQVFSDFLGKDGLLAMPAHSNDLSDPADWENPPVPREWIPVIRDYMPPFDPRRSGCARLGAVANQFRSMPDVLRSAHPHYSLSALGKHARELVADHETDFSMSTTSPYGRLYEADAQIVLFGVDWDSCTLLHVAQNIAGCSEVHDYPAPVGRDSNGKTVWKTYRDYDFDTEDFIPAGGAFEQFAAGNTSLFAQASLGFGRVKKIAAKAAVDFAADLWSAARKAD
jgi:aminoglycoside 3-N-acetyltransferase